MIEGQHNHQGKADRRGQSQNQQPIEQREIRTFFQMIFFSGASSIGISMGWLEGVPAHSYFSDSTGSICAARVAGMVPKTTPTSIAAARAMATDQGEIGTT